MQSETFETDFGARVTVAQIDPEFALTKALAQALERYIKEIATVFGGEANEGAQRVERPEEITYTKPIEIEGGKPIPPPANGKRYQVWEFEFIADSQGWPFALSPKGHWRLSKIETRFDGFSVTAMKNVLEWVVRTIESPNSPSIMAGPLERAMEQERRDGLWKGVER